MSAQTKVSGTWRNVTAPYVKVDDNWKIAKSAWTKIDEKWKSWFLQGGLTDIGLGESENPEYQNFNANIGRGAGTFDADGQRVNSVIIQPDGKVLLAGRFVSFNWTNINRIVRLNSDGTLDTAFVTNVGTGADAEVTSIALQPDGKILVGGTFTTFNETTTNRFIRLNSDGTRDTAFMDNIGTGSSGPVNAIGLQTDGKIVITGNFSTFNNIFARNVIRLNSDGTRDSVFTSNADQAGMDNGKRSIAIQPDGKILLGGTFAGTSINRILRLNSDGTRDTAFTTNIGAGIDRQVTSITLQSDGKILLGGQFTTFNEITTNGIIRLNSDGTLDTAFMDNIGTGADAEVTSIALQPDGKIMVGGLFSSFSGTTAYGILRLNSDGTRNMTFISNFLGTGVSSESFSSGSIYSIAIQSNGKIFIAGAFSSFNNTDIYNVAEINPDGTFIQFAGPSSFINSIAIQPDGKILLGGGFLRFDGVFVRRVIRLTANGTIDTAFINNIGTGANSTISEITLQSDGKILLVGSFTTFNEITTNRILRLNSDGTRDTAFMANVGTGANATVNTIKIQSNNKILLGGQFSSFNNQPRQSFVSLSSSGLDQTEAYLYENIGPSGSLNSVKIQPDGKILVGGSFSIFNGVNTKGIARLNLDASIDTAFATNIGTGAGNIFQFVSSIALQPDGKILVGGNFTTFNETVTNYFIRLNSDGTRDTAFMDNIGTGPTNAVSAITLQSDGKILVGGNFTTFNGTTTNRFIRLNSDGTRDTAFMDNIGTGANNEVRAIIIQSDGKIILGGQFTNFNDATRNRIIRLNSDGTLDTAFMDNIGTGANNTVHVLQQQSDGKILVGGNFTTFNGTTTNRFIRLNSDGTRDTAFMANVGTGTEWIVYAIDINTSSGQILLGGDFTTFNGATVNRIVRLNSDGTRDTVFNTNTGSGANGIINAIAIRSDGKIFIAGAFSSFNLSSAPRLAMLETTGSRDLNFLFFKGFNFAIFSMAVQEDDKILVGGNFTSLNGLSVNRIARLNADSTTDTTFITNIGSGLNNFAQSIAIQPDGKILVGGNFTTFNGTTTNRFIRLNSDGTRDTAFMDNVGVGANQSVRAIAIQPDGKILVGGNFTTFNGTTTNRFIRLNSDGTRHTAFMANVGTGANESVEDIAIQPDKKIIIGGFFTTFNNQLRRYVARVGGDIIA